MLYIVITEFGVGPLKFCARAQCLTRLTPALALLPPFLPLSGVCGSKTATFPPIKQHQKSYSSGDHATEDVFPESHRRQEDLLLLHLRATLGSPPAMGHTWRAHPLPAQGHLAGGPQRLARPSRVCHASCLPVEKGCPSGFGQRPMGTRHANEQVRWRPAGLGSRG